MCGQPLTALERSTKPVTVCASSWMASLPALASATPSTRRRTPPAGPPRTGPGRRTGSTPEATAGRRAPGTRKGYRPAAAGGPGRTPGTAAGRPRAAAAPADRGWSAGRAAPVGRWWRALSSRTLGLGGRMRGWLGRRMGGWLAGRRSGNGWRPRRGGAHGLHRGDRAGADVGEGRHPGLVGEHGIVTEQHARLVGAPEPERLGDQVEVQQRSGQGLLDAQRIRRWADAVGDLLQHVHGVP